jgi:DNA-binding Lrp family transcriptional regulator
MVIKLDLKDKKILYELDKNSRASLPEIAKKVGLSKEVVFHRINRLTSEKVILKFLAVPATYRLGLTGYKVYLRLSNTSKENLDSFVKYLKKEKSVYWTGICKGRWDFMFGIWAKDVHEFFIVYNKMLNKFSKYIQEKELSISADNIQYNRQWFYSDKKERIEFTFGEKEDQIEIDEKDQKILDILNYNSRTKLIDIAEKLKLSPKVVSYKIKELERKKMIRGYKVLLNSNVMGFNTYKAFVFFKNINEKRKEEFLDYCKSLPNVINVVITFAPWDLEIMLETKKDEEYYRVMDDIKEKFSDIIKFYDSVLMTSEPKHKYLINTKARD